MLKIFRRSHKSRSPSVDIKEEKVERYTFVGEQDLAQELLSEPILNSTSLDLVLHRFAKNNPLADEAKPMIGLHAAIERFEAFIRKESAEFNFYSDLLPKIATWALDGYASNSGRTPKYTALNQLPLAADSSSVTISRLQARFLLAHTFFMNSKSLKGMTYGELSFKHLYNSRITIGHERMICILAYFYQVADLSEDELKEDIIFKRVASPSPSAVKWDTEKLQLQADTVQLHSASMEETEDPFFVNFANKQMHVGEILASCTQEEVLFNMAPEAFVGILFCEQIGDHEVLVISNLRRYSLYTGFLDSFRFAGFYPKKHKFSMLVLDAVFQDHWTQSSINRDLNKAYLGFKEASGASVSTGNWGCGAFGGDTNAKFVQQLCAATKAGCKLNYSTFGDEDQCRMLEKLQQQLIDKKMTVAQLFKLLDDFQEELQKRKLDSFLEFLVKRLDLSFR